MLGWFNFPIFYNFKNLTKILKNKEIIIIQTKATKNMYELNV